MIKLENFDDSRGVAQSCFIRRRAGAEALFATVDWVNMERRDRRLGPFRFYHREKGPFDLSIIKQPWVRNRTILFSHHITKCAPLAQGVEQKVDKRSNGASVLDRTGNG